MVVGKKTLKAYDFNDLYDYFNYINDSIINGQHKQSRDLFNKLSRLQKRHFIIYARENNFNIKYEDFL